MCPFQIRSANSSSFNYAFAANCAQFTVEHLPGWMDFSSWHVQYTWVNHYLFPIISFILFMHLICISQISLWHDFLRCAEPPMRFCQVLIWACSNKIMHPFWIFTTVSIIALSLCAVHERSERVLKLARELHDWKNNELNVASRLNCHWRWETYPTEPHGLTHLIFLAYVPRGLW